MEDIFVGQLMSSPVQTVGPETSIHEGASLMLEQDIGSLVVVDEEDRPEGILTATDFVRLAADRRSSEDTTVESYMTAATITTTVNETVRDVADKMVEENVHHMPVVDLDDTVIGILTSTDLTAYLSHDRRPSPR